MGDRQFVTHQGSEQAQISKLNGPAERSSYAAKAGGLDYLGKQLSIQSLGGLLGLANSESSELLIPIWPIVRITSGGNWGGRRDCQAGCAYCGLCCLCPSWGLVSEAVTPGV
jgi:hypothetical protein